MEMELSQLALAKEQIDVDLLPALERNAAKCGESIEHLLGALESSLRASSTVSAQLAASLLSQTEDAGAAVANSVVAMNQLLARVQQLNDDMAPVADIAAQVRQIGQTLTVLEKAAKKLEKQHEQAK